MQFTKQGSDFNEIEVMNLINSKPNTKIEKATKKYSSFDLYGLIDNVPTLIEVKERRQWWGEMWIEQDKLLAIFDKAKRYNGTVNCCLVVSVKGEHLMYDLKDIWKYGKRSREEMNRQTAASFDYQGIKTHKNIIKFRKDSYAFNLNTGELGKSYEAI